MNSNPTFAHPNSKAYNRLVYEINYAFIKRFESCYKGHLYDLGCGAMVYREWFLHHVDRYTGIDWQKSPHEVHADILADLNQPIPVAAEVADTVISFSVMEHLCEPQVMLDEAFRILKPGGAIIAQVPFMWWIHEAPHDYFRYTRHGLEYMLRKASFKEIEIHPMSGFWTMWFLKLNYRSTRWIRGPYLLRQGITLLLSCLWALDQRLAPFLDKRCKSAEETIGYFFLAQKPWT